MQNPDNSLRLSPTFLDGVLLTGAAIPDAVVLYCGSNCILEHVRHAYINHDWGQTLLRDDMRSRLITTLTDDTLAPLGVAEVLEHHVRKLMPVWQPGLIILSELSRMTIAGDDLRTIVPSVMQTTGVPTVATHSRYLARDHETAFTNLLHDIALLIPETAFDQLLPDRVAIIGYLFERNEGDHEGNIAAMEGLLCDLGLDVAATWLSSRPFISLCEAARASLLIALPYGRKAARALAARSGAEVLDVDLPVGLGATREFLQLVAHATGRMDRVDEVISRHLARVIPRVEWAVTRALAGRRAVLSLTSDWLKVVERMFVEDFGIEVAAAFRRSRFREGEEELGVTSNDFERMHDPSVATFGDRVLAEVARRGLDLVVASAWEKAVLDDDGLKVPFFEFGYPTWTRHELLLAPMVTFTGVLTWAQRLCDTMRGS